MEIVYSDKNIVVCIKPVGVDSEKQMPDLIKANLGGEAYTVHRLDKMSEALWYMPAASKLLHSCQKLYKTEP